MIISNFLSKLNIIFFDFKEHIKIIYQNVFFTGASPSLIKALIAVGAV